MNKPDEGTPGRLSQGDVLRSPDGKTWRVNRIYKHVVKLEGYWKEKTDFIHTVPMAEALTYQRAGLPKTVHKGQVLYMLNQRCEVTGFMAPFFMKLKDESGFENAIPMGRDHLSAYGVRLPFTDEQ